MKKMIIIFSSLSTLMLTILTLLSSFNLIVSLPVLANNNIKNESLTIRNSLQKPSVNLNINSSSSSMTTEQPPITNVSELEMTPDVNHALTIDHQNIVINLGQSLSSGITNAIVRPITFFNNLIGSAAGSLPGLFAANGAALGTAIATPIQLGTLAANAAISGITGTVVSVPISLASGGVAQLVGMVGTGRQLWHSTIGSDPKNSTFWQNGELWLQPLAVVTGANSILAGVSLNALSQGVKNLGWGIERFGVSLSNTGKNAKQMGSVLIGWANGKPVYATSILNETLITNINQTEQLKQQQPLMDTITEIDFDKMIQLNSTEIMMIEASITTTMSTIIENDLQTSNDIDNNDNLIDQNDEITMENEPKQQQIITNKFDEKNMTV
uniref:Uncharacterized protein LOC113798755 n=1 Tax=Dermatophagoides pteronyssinus TaxID=6956 RepID=A0A6P6YIM9_DERPT|nr:uncharacterized protein LOC113798755 [Dermatophagoides pteronyssinus]